MSLITDFSKLYEWELNQFAERLVNTINAEHTFTEETDFEIDNIEVDKDGTLAISINNKQYITATYEATWSCGDPDEIKYPEDPEVDGSTTDEINKSFTTFKANIKGYNVNLTIDDYDEDDLLEVEVTGTSNEDAGIGSYEFWGEVGYDSRPYIEVEGLLTYGYNCYMTLWVDPAK